MITLQHKNPLSGKIFFILATLEGGTHDEWMKLESGFEILSTLEISINQFIPIVIMCLLNFKPIVNFIFLLFLKSQSIK